MTDKEPASAPSPEVAARDAERPKEPASGVSLGDERTSPDGPANGTDSPPGERAGSTAAAEPAKRAGVPAETPSGPEERAAGDEPKDAGRAGDEPAGDAQDAAQDAAQDIAKDISDDAAKGTAEGTVADAAKGAAEDDAKDAAKDGSRDGGQGPVAENAGGAAAEDTAKSADGAAGDDADADEPVPGRRRYDCSDAEQRAAGLADAAAVLKVGDLVVLPTDTVYGVAADAFTASAVSALMLAKGRGRDIPVPVLVGTVRAATALVDDLGTYGQDLIDEFWPGPLTLICKAGRSLRWDIGDTKGTVAIRMPLHQLALDLLKETGPLAVSSANLAGAPAATTIAEAEQQLGDSVSVYLDGGPCADRTPSTILDLTTPVPRLLRRGAISVEKLRGIIGYVATED